MDLTSLSKKITALPTLPAVAQQINNEWKKDSLTAQSLGDIISKDPSLTSRVLQLANSAYYGLPRQVDTVNRAVTVLGFNTIKNLALTVAVFNIFSPLKDSKLDMKGLWHHCLGCAVAAKAIARHNGSPSLAEKAFICGIIHDIGQVIIAMNLPDQIENIIREVKQEGKELCEAENLVLGFTHQDMGQLLANKWHFPEKYCQIIQQHHVLHTTYKPDGDLDPYLLALVFAGDQMAKKLNLGESLNQGHQEIPETIWTHLGIKNDMLQYLEDKISQDYETMVQSWSLS